MHNCGRKLKRNPVHIRRTSTKRGNLGTNRESNLCSTKHLLPLGVANVPSIVLQESWVLLLKEQGKSSKCVLPALNIAETRKKNQNDRQQMKPNKWMFWIVLIIYATQVLVLHCWYCVSNICVFCCKKKFFCVISVIKWERKEKCSYSKKLKITSEFRPVAEGQS